ncbi:hypothetical protein FPQ18DRAFT_392790 [Pyronema domesticum]|nr:hypothetical protein FPQ18DRAFT_392790 [Pyronema domesticum]
MKEVDGVKLYSLEWMEEVQRNMMLADWLHVELVKLMRRVAKEESERKRVKWGVKKVVMIEEEEYDGEDEEEEWEEEEDGEEDSDPDEDTEDVAWVVREDKCAVFRRLPDF